MKYVKGQKVYAYDSNGDEPLFVGRIIDYDYGVYTVAALGKSRKKMAMYESNIKPYICITSIVEEMVAL